MFMDRAPDETKSEKGYWVALAVIKPFCSLCRTDGQADKLNLESTKLLNYLLFALGN